MKIRIIKSTDADSWYAKRIGETHRVEWFERNRSPTQGIPEDVYWVREGGRYNPVNWVRASDATELNKTPLGVISDTSS